MLKRMFAGCCSLLVCLGLTAGCTPPPGAPDANQGAPTTERPPKPAGEKAEKKEEKKAGKKNGDQKAETKAPAVNDKPAADESPAK